MMVSLHTAICKHKKSYLKIADMRNRSHEIDLTPEL